MQEPLTCQELVVMQEAGKAAADFLNELKQSIQPGISTKDIELKFNRFLKGYPGMEGAFKGYMGYPASLCVSINDTIIHGIPSTEELIKYGDLVSVDLGIKYKGLFVDTARTYFIGKVSKLAKRLTEITKKALYIGIKHARIGARVGDIGSAIQEFVEKNRFSIIRKFVGHGIGKDLHLPPEVPNFGVKGQGPVLCEDQIIAIEPMVSAGSWEVKILGDGWTAKTKDGSLSAHFEHTVAVTKKGPLIIT